MSAFVTAANLASAAMAAAAALFWFRSAAQQLPESVPYWDFTPDTDPFLRALRESVRTNRWAAGCAGAAALLQAVATLLPLAVTAH